MPTIIPIFHIFVFLTCLFASHSIAKSQALPQLDDTQPIYLESDYLEVTGPTDKRTVRAEGNVLMQHKDSEMRSQTMSLDVSSQSVYAGGGVSSSTSAHSMIADEVRYSGSSSTAQLGKGFIVSPSGDLFVTGSTIWKTGADRFAIRDATVSTCTCDLPTPPAYMTASTMTVESEGYIRMRNAVIWFEGVPIFASPFLMFPSGSERKSGLLFPEFGYDQLQGFFINPTAVLIPGDRSEILIQGRVNSLQGFGGNVYLGYTGRGSSGSIFADVFHRSFETRYPGASYSVQSWTDPDSGVQLLDLKNNQAALDSILPATTDWIVRSNHQFRYSDWLRADFIVDFLNQADTSIQNAQTVEEITREQRRSSASMIFGTQKFVSGISASLALQIQEDRSNIAQQHPIPELGFFTHNAASRLGWTQSSWFSANNLVYLRDNQFFLNPRSYSYSGNHIRTGVEQVFNSLHTQSGGLRLKFGAEGFAHSESEERLKALGIVFSDTDSLGARYWMNNRLDLNLERMFLSKGNKYWSHKITPFFQSNIQQFQGEHSLTGYYIQESRSAQDDTVFLAEAGIGQTLISNQIQLELSLYARTATHAERFGPVSWQPMTTGNLDFSIQHDVFRVGYQLSIFESNFLSSESSFELTRGRGNLGITHAFTASADSFAYHNTFLPARNFVHSTVNNSYDVEADIHHLGLSAGFPIVRWLGVLGGTTILFDADKTIPFWSAGIQLFSSCDCWEILAQVRKTDAIRFSMEIEIAGLGRRKF